MAVVDRHGLPVAVHVASASPYEPHLVPATLDARFFADLPTRLIGDRGYDSDRLDDTLMTTYGIEMIAAHRRGRARTQDGRPLRRVRRRWKVERFFAWLHHSRRAVTRWEYHVDNFLGMIQLACARMVAGLRSAGSASGPACRHGGSHLASRVLLPSDDARRASAVDSGTGGASGHQDDAAVHAPEPGCTRFSDPFA